MYKRQPFLAYISWYNFKYANSHVKKAAVDKAVLADFLRLKSKLELFRRNVLMWTRFTQVHVVLYENLIRNLESGLVELTEFLEIPGDQARLRCTRENSEGGYHRREAGKKEFPFSREDSDYLIRAICDVDKILRNQDGRRRLPIQIYNQELAEKFVGSQDYPLPEISCSRSLT